MSMTTVRSEIRRIVVRKSGRNATPGPFTPQKRPSRKATPRSHSLRIRIEPNRYATARIPTTVRKPISSSSTCECFDDDCGSLAPADAGGAEPEGTLPPAEGVEQVRGKAGAAGGEGMSERDRTPIDVGAGAVEPQLLLDREVLRRERLVDLDQIDLREG